MFTNTKFLKFCLDNDLDMSYNPGSKYFNSRATRIAYYKFTGEI